MSEPITSPQNEKLKLVRRLADARARANEGLFTTEGEDLLEAGLAAGWEPEAVLAVAGLEIEGEAEITPVERELLGTVATLGSGTRAIAIWPLPAEAGPESDPAAGCVYLDAVGDPGNVGAIQRSATALTGARLVLGPGCADPYSPKATRASMGALFANPPRRGELASCPAPRLGLAAHGGDELAVAIAALRPRTLCLGAEREGLGESVLAACDAAATIPVRPGAESLNVAATAAIALERISSAAAAPPDAASEDRD